MHPGTVRAGDTVTLKCRTSCQVPSTVWFKDGRPVAKPEFQAQAEDSGNYVCAVEGQDSALSDPVALDVRCKCVYYDIFERCVMHVAFTAYDCPESDEKIDTILMSVR